MRVLSGLLLGLVLAATAAHSHDKVVLPELPVPVIERIFLVDDLDEAFRWAGWERPEWRVGTGWVESEFLGQGA